MLTPEQIKALRLHLEMSPTQFAATLGITEAAVRRWETGDRHPNYARMVELNKLAKKSGFAVPA